MAPAWRGRRYRAASAHMVPASRFVSAPASTHSRASGSISMSKPPLRLTRKRPGPGCLRGSTRTATLGPRRRLASSWTGGCMPPTLESQLVRTTRTRSAYTSGRSSAACALGRSGSPLRYAALVLDEPTAAGVLTRDIFSPATCGHGGRTTGGPGWTDRRGDSRVRVAAALLCHRRSPGGGRLPVGSRRRAVIAMPARSRRAPGSAACCRHPRSARGALSYARRRGSPPCTERLGSARPCTSSSAPGRRRCRAAGRR